MLERTLLTVALLAAIVLTLLAARWWLAARRRATVRRHGGAPSATVRAGGAVGGRILYFSTRHCVQCRELQEPALERLVAGSAGRVTVERVDAVERQDLAKQYRVLTVPTTAVFDSQGRLVEVNYGYAPAERLAGQLGLAATSLPPPPAYQNLMETQKEPGPYGPGSFWTTPRDSQLA